MCITQRKLNYVRQLTNGLILLASPPSLLMASRMAARSTTAGTPVKSYKENKTQSISVTLDNPVNHSEKTFLEDHNGRP